MSQVQIAWLEFILVGGLGFILTLSGMMIHIVAQRTNKLCTKQTEGIVVQYRFAGEGRMNPIVQYFVDGVCYKACKKFRGIITKQISGLPAYVEPNVYEDEKGYLHVKIGPIANLRQLAEQLWPVGSKMTVYYNPENPKKCYIDRPIYGSITSILFIIIGIVTIMLSLIVFILIQI